MPCCLEVTSVQVDEEAIRTCPDDELPDLVDKLWGKYKFQPKPESPTGGLLVHFMEKRISPNYTSRLVWSAPRPHFLIDFKAAVDLARSLGIRTPPIERFHRIFTQGRYYYLIISRYIPGISLEKLLPRIDREETIRLAFQLRSMLETMHQKTSRYAGGIGTLAFDRGGRFMNWDEIGLPKGSTTAKDIANVANYRWGYRRETHGDCRETPEKMEWDIKNGPLAPNLPLVFTHYGLVPRRLIRDNNGDLWITEWDNAGWYPACFDRASMIGGIFRKDRMARQEWELFRSIANGYKWSREVKAINRINNCTRSCCDNRENCARLGLTKSEYPIIIEEWPADPRVRYGPV
ncbi:hypothetical protein TWF102_007710 [Orbilia oligospora]|uniref:Aminoglycoside phosphotransferase domain-containing protein n=1 Tax=Orbilia oligospora TaxID=2813651 RepID=A0A7C8P4S8_ORBOL|nr:hypothetical protein TWF102_007710 [Orbilia oligospora]KAF3101376.1 hypothetical protein TWF103_007950 [Orbilia oligospora]KAF3129201.1 hypothetical protein TWF703_009045 [Orbilia oligospora]